MVGDRKAAIDFERLCPQFEIFKRVEIVRFTAFEELCIVRFWSNGYRQ
jgi:hypothetical protein